MIETRHKFTLADSKKGFFDLNITKIIVFSSIFERKVVSLRKIYKYQGLSV